MKSVTRSRHAALAGLALFPVLALVLPGVADQPTAPAGPALRVPAGLVIETVAGPPLVQYPLFAAFDDRGRLFVAEGTGTNLPGEKLLNPKRGRILLLEDTDGDGKFDTSKVFADELVFPTGVLWHDGALYATSHPSLWKFQDTTGKGKADRREALVGDFKFNGNGCDIHGPFLGPDGRLYWTDGRHGYKVKTREGELLEGLASRVWRCRTDGRGIERLCGGGFDNPVELVFTPEGDLIGTMDQGPGDALLHYVEGGVYPMEHACLKEFPMTGPLLGSVRQYTAALPVALCGLARYRSDHLGKQYQGSLFSAQFNVGRVEQHRLVRDGSTFRSADKDFITPTGPDVHLTDVLEDADGSLLVVDMGAWFNYGCPTSKIAKPKVLGGIYRVRRPGAAKVADPWGQKLKLATLPPADLIALLGDARPKVRDQAVTQLAKRGADAVIPLAKVVGETKTRPAAARRNAVWALCRIGGAEALAALRPALKDPDAGVRQAAAHAAGLEKDARALDALAGLVARDEPAVRLKAAEALGRIGRPEAVPALLEGVRQTAGDRFLQHAQVYALLQINDRKALRATLDDPSPRVRLAGLVALDQMKDGRLTREQVAPLLDTDDADLQQAAVAVMSRRPDWSRDSLTLLRKWLASPELSAAQASSLSGALLAFGSDAKIQQLVVDGLADRKGPVARRLLLLRVVARCRSSTLPKPWAEALGGALEDGDPSVRREAVAALKARNLGQFDRKLAALSRDDHLPAGLRVAALDCVAVRLKALDAGSFALLTGQLGEKADPLLRVAAARTLGASPLDGRQLVEVTRHLAKAGPTVVPLLTPAFTRSDKDEVGKALVSALKDSPGAEALTETGLDQLLARYSAAVKELAGPLRAKLAARRHKQAAHLTGLAREIEPLKGDAERGRQVFFSNKVGCYACHRAAGKGGLIGPDLSQVARFRSAGDLLESIVYPSSAVAADYRTYRVTTKQGRQAQGVILRESADAIYLRTAELAEVRVARKDVEEVTPSETSLMPDGLDKAMTRQELSDLLAFLLKQK